MSPIYIVVMNDNVQHIDGSRPYCEHLGVFSTMLKAVKCAFNEEYLLNGKEYYGKLNTNDLTEENINEFLKDWMHIHYIDSKNGEKDTWLIYRACVSYSILDSEDGAYIHGYANRWW